MRDIDLDEAENIPDLRSRPRQKARPESDSLSWPQSTKQFPVDSFRYQHPLLSVRLPSTHPPPSFLFFFSFVVVVVICLFPPLL